jgi:hypothetical protein
MIERRYPIQTVLAERKMFAGGGAVLPQQMMPQQQQMMPPQQSGGILASSGPLLDAVAAGAVNPDGDGGASLSDVQGFRVGGSVITPQGIPVNLSAEAAEAADAARGAMVDFGPTPWLGEVPSRITPYMTSAERVEEDRRAFRDNLSRMSRVAAGENFDPAASTEFVDPDDLGGDPGRPDARVLSPEIVAAALKMQEGSNFESAGKEANKVFRERYRSGFSEENPIVGRPDGEVYEEGLGGGGPSKAAEAAKSLNLQGALTEGLFAAEEAKISDEDGTPVSTKAEQDGGYDITSEDSQTSGDLNTDMFDFGGEDDGTASNARRFARVAMEKALQKSGLGSDVEKPAKKSKKEMKDFITEFRSAMPEYEGMSESEKGYAIMEAGLRIMAGKSSNALTNIAEGLKGLGPQFAKDAKDKRSWNRQIDLSAAKYALSGVAKEQAKEDTLAKEGRQILHKTVAKKAFIDPITNRKVDAGQIYTVTRDQIDNGIYSELPLTFVSLYSAETTSRAKLIAATNKRILDQVNDVRKANVIGYKESKQIKESLGKSTENFVHASGGRALVENIIQKIVANPSDIVGGKAGINQAWGNVRNFFGNPDKKYNNLKAFEADLKIAFQKVIPVALRNIQAGNSISDRDVSNLAQAFIAGGLINKTDDGVFSLNVDLATLPPEILVGKLQQMNSMFKSAQEKALVTFDQEIYNLQGAEKGRYDAGYFRPQLESIAPALEMYRAGQGGKQTPAMDNVLKVTDYFDLSSGVSIIKPLPKG